MVRLNHGVYHSKKLMYCNVIHADPLDRAFHIGNGNKAIKTSLQTTSLGNKKRAKQRINFKMFSSQ